MSRPGAWEIPDYEIMLHFWRRAERRRQRLARSSYRGETVTRAWAGGNSSGTPGPRHATLADALDYALGVVGRVLRREKDLR